MRNLNVPVLAIALVMAAFPMATMTSVHSLPSPPEPRFVVAQPIPVGPYDHVTIIIDQNVKLWRPVEFGDYVYTIYGHACDFYFGVGPQPNIEGFEPCFVPETLDDPAQGGCLPTAPPTNVWCWRDNGDNSDNIRVREVLIGDPHALLASGDGCLIFNKRDGSGQTVVRGPVAGPGILLSDGPQCPPPQV